MRSLKYLNTVLTIIAVLLTLNLWTIWTVGAGTPDAATRAHAAGIPDAGAQRNQVIDLLKALNNKTDQLNGLLTSGDAKVTVTNPSGEPKSE